MADKVMEETIFLVNLSGRGDKDLAHVNAILSPETATPSKVKHRGEA